MAKPEKILDKTEAREEAAEAAPTLPAKVRLVSPHGYIDENGRHRYWHGGDVISDPAEIALLMGRKAPVEPVE